MKRLLPTGSLVLIVLASCGLNAQDPALRPPKIGAALAARGAASPDTPVLVHLLLDPTVLYRASAEAKAGTARLRTVRNPDVLAEAEARRVDFAGRTARLLAADAAAVIEAVKGVHGKIVYEALSVADVMAIVPGSGLSQLAALPQIHEILEDVAMQGGLDVSVAAVGASSFWNAGKFGTNVKVGIIDSGADLTNPGFNGVVAHSSVYQAAAQAVDTCYADQADADDRQGHGSHVNGTVFSRGASQCLSCKGVANGAELYNLKAGYKSSCSSTPSIRWSDAQQSVSDSPAVQIFNMSYGTPYTCDGNNLKYNCDDNAQSRQWDTTIDTHGQSVTICAGNDAMNGGTNTLWSPAIAYNVLSVANASDNFTTSRTDDFIYSTSSYGPTAGGRKKPDIAAPGTSIQSTNYNWEAGTQFVSYTGTSMAAPHVAGAMALLLNAAATENIPALLDPRALKAVLINTAELRNGLTGWDAHWGWGYLNLANAYSHRSAVFLDSAKPGTTTGTLYAGSTIGNSGKATLVWNRHPYSSYNCPGGPLTLNNLDLHAYNEADGSLLTSSASSVDNVEQVIAKDRAGVVLRAVAVCTGFSAEPYALATENGFAAAAPVLQLNIAPKNFTTGGHATVSVEAANQGAIAAHNVQVTLTLPAGMSMDSPSPSIVIPHLPAHSSTNLEWIVGAPAGNGFYNAIASAESSSYGENFSASSTQQWIVGPVEAFVLTMARPSRPHRSAAAQVIVAGQPRAFVIEVAGAQEPAPVSAECQAPDGTTCEILSQDKRAPSRVTVKVRPALEAMAGRQTVSVVVKSSSASGRLELPLDVVPANKKLGRGTDVAAPDLP